MIWIFGIMKKIILVKIFKSLFSTISFYHFNYTLIEIQWLLKLLKNFLIKLKTIPTYKKRIKTGKKDGIKTRKNNKMSKRLILKK